MKFFALLAFAAVLAPFGALTSAASAQRQTFAINPNVAIDLSLSGWLSK